MKPQRFEFTDETLFHLRACRAQGMTKVQACAELGTTTTTVDRAAKRSDKLADVQRLFPHGGGGKRSQVELPRIIDGMRKLKPEQIIAPLEIDRSLPHVRAACMDWRAV